MLLKTNFERLIKQQLKKLTNLDTEIGEKWFENQGWTPLPFQRKVWERYGKGDSGLINAPTGSGKTYAVLIPAIIENLHLKNTGPYIIWVTPIKALAKEIFISSTKVLQGLNVDWRVGIRTGDTKSAERQNQIKNPPEILITTPESIHIIMAGNIYSKFFDQVKLLVADEWHELMGSKRGVLLELALSRIKGISTGMKIWGISATIGNLEEAKDALLGTSLSKNSPLICSHIKKEIIVETIIPDKIEKYPWSGHLGIRLLDKILPIINASKTTLIFTNTRAQCEIWYQKLLDIQPDLAGIIAMHHGSISRNLRDWVEDKLYIGELKAVICTSSLDLGVDFRPVETIIQIGSPKGVARFVQRAGRSGHSPGMASKIYFLPTHSLELAESAALRSAIEKNNVETRIPFIRSFDVLIQYLMTLAISEGFNPNKVLQEIKNTYCFESITEDEWFQILYFLEFGAKSLEAYDEYKKVEKNKGRYQVNNKRVAQRHRLSIGTIVSEAMLTVKYMSGKRLGVLEEWFAAQLHIGDNFWFAGRSLELVRLKDMSLIVKNSKKKSGKVPSYGGSRMPLSSQMSKMLREELYSYEAQKNPSQEIKILSPLFELQKTDSILPSASDFLIEYIETSEGHHLLFYPFEGRNVHEGMGALIAKRISRIIPISFSIGMNDYGFELLSDKKLDVDAIINQTLFSEENLFEDIQASINAIELSRRKFRDISRISGLIFAGYPGKIKKERHLQSSSQLLFDVFREYESDNLLYLQTYEEVRTFQLEENRLRSALRRIANQEITITKPIRPTPFSFPIIVDGLSRERLSSETLEDRIARMKLDIIK